MQRLVYYRRKVVGEHYKWRSFPFHKLCRVQESFDGTWNRLVRHHKFHAIWKKWQKYFYSEISFPPLHDTHKFRCAYFPASPTVAAREGRLLLFICLFTCFSFCAVNSSFARMWRGRGAERYIFIMLAKDKKMHSPDWHYSFASRLYEGPCMLNFAFITN